MFSDDEKAKSDVLDRRNVKKFYGSGATLSSLYGAKMGVPDLLTKFDTFERLSTSDIDRARLISASDEIFGKIKSETDLKKFVKNENMKEYSSKIKDGKVEWNGKTYDIEKDLLNNET
jgi:hypothetical protein